jgi:hypothetical protein
MCGSNLAILFADSIVVLIRNFDMVAKGHVGLNDASLLISLISSDNPFPVPATYLAFEKGKVVVTSVCYGHALLLFSYADDSTAQWNIRRRSRRPREQIPLNLRSRRNAVASLLPKHNNFCCFPL